MNCYFLINVETTRKVKTITKDVSEMCDVLKIIHRKDGVYDLFQDNNWIMSRGCIDNILNFLATTSKYSAIRIVFEDQSFEEDCNEKTRYLD